MMFPDPQAYQEFFIEDGKTIACSIVPHIMFDSLFYESQFVIRNPIAHRVYVKCKIVDQPSKVKSIQAWSITDERFTDQPNLKNSTDKWIQNIDAVLKKEGLQVSILSEMDAGYGMSIESYVLACIVYFLKKENKIKDYQSCLQQIVPPDLRMEKVSIALSVLENKKMQTIYELDKKRYHADEDTPYVETKEILNQEQLGFNLEDIVDIAMVRIDKQVSPAETVHKTKNQLKRQEEVCQDIIDALDQKVGPLVSGMIKEKVPQRFPLREKIILEILAELKAEYKDGDRIFNAFYILSRIFDVEASFDREIRYIREMLGPNAITFNNRAKNRLVIIARHNTIRKKIEDMAIGQQIFHSWHEHQKRIPLGEFDPNDDD